MSWQQLSLHTTAAHVEAIADVLSELHEAQAVTFLDAEDQPLFEPAPGTMPLWQDIKLVALFAADKDLSAVLDYCRSLDGIANIAVESLAEQSWERVCMQDFQPMRFGRQLWIVPSWCEVPHPQAINILLDPGLAFGTGTHPTTAMCLEALEAVDLKGKSVIDYGCGSGVLAIAAMKLGAKAVWATDNDPQALLATRDNATKNAINLELFHIEEPGSLSVKTADIVVANILAKPLISLNETLINLCESQLILSGILAEQATKVENAYSSAFNFFDKKQQDEWVCLLAQKK